MVVHTVVSSNSYSSMFYARRSVQMCVLLIDENKVEKLGIGTNLIIFLRMCELKLPEHDSVTCSTDPSFTIACCVFSRVEAHG